MLLLESLAPARESLGPFRNAPALAVALAGLALVGLAREPGRRWLRELARGSAVAAALLAAATLALGLGDPEHAPLMGLPTALGLLLVGVAIPLAASSSSRAAQAAELIAWASLALGTLVVLGHLYAVEGIRGLGGVVSSPWAALGVVLLSVAVLTSRSGFRLARVLAGRSLGAEQLRRALPALLGIPLASGLAAALAVRLDHLGPSAAIALLTLLTLGGTGLFAATHARRIDALARERSRLEGLFRRTFENAAVGIAHLDADGRWLRVNDRLCEILGRSREELRSATLIGVTHPEDVAVVTEAQQDLAAGSVDSHRFEQRCITKTGSEVAVELVVSSERNAAGRLSYLVAVVQDVSEQRRTARELGLLQRALACSVDGVVILTSRRPEGEIVYVNPAFTRITGYSAEEALGQGWELLGELGPEQPPLEELCGAMSRDEGLSLLLRSRTKHGERFWSEIRLAPVADARSGAVTHYIGVLEDVTARLEAAAERERLLAGALAAREEAERAGRSKDEFFALVSHELRSPLGAVASWLPMLRSDARAEVRQRALSVVERNVSLLARLIRDLLDASRIASGKLEIERCALDLLDVVRTAVVALEPAARERGVALSLRAAPEVAYVEGDPERLDQVVRNLIENGLKFTPPGGRVELSVESHGDRLALEVSDTGEGIPAELLPRIFERFRQGESGPRGAAKGLGLGLAIVRHLVELHGGRVEAWSEGPGCGTRMRVELPATAAPTRSGLRPEGDGAHSLEGVCVLLLDPDRVSAEALALALEAADAEVAWVRGADEALVEGNALVPEAVVADLDERPGEAEKLVRGLRERHAARAPVAVALSTDDTLASRRRARDAGFDAYLARPFYPDRLIGAIRGLLARPRRVLVVDDDRDTADSLAMLLARRGFEVERAYDAAEALALARSFEPAVVVTDIRLGDGHGAELARALHALGRPLRVIAASGANRYDLGAAGRLFDGFVRKPIDLAALVALLQAR